MAISLFWKKERIVCLVLKRGNRLGRWEDHGCHILLHRFLIDALRIHSLLLNMKKILQYAKFLFPLLCVLRKDWLLTLAVVSCVIFKI